MMSQLDMKNMNQIEQANALKKCIDDQGISYAELARQLNMTAKLVSSRVKLLQLTDDVQHLIADGVLPLYIAKGMIGLDTEKQSQIIGFFDLDDLPGKKLFREFSRAFAKSNDEIAKVLECVELGKAFAVQVMYKASGLNPEILEYYDDDTALEESDAVYSHLEIVELSQPEIKKLSKRHHLYVFDYKTAQEVLRHAMPTSENSPYCTIGQNYDGSNKVLMAAPQAYTGGAMIF